ncbi:MAG: prepilin peptidase [Ruminococcaceae bacterium]|nr:prepilin peptidase [Oscillospiraceae bacterium]
MLWTIIYVFWALIGLCIGSYLNVVIYRVPLKMSTAFPPSHCPNCNERIRWYDNIPVLSYLMLGRKCRYCRQPISPRYMLVELANMLLWLGCALLFAPDALPTAVISSIACSVLLCVAFIDLEHMFIPDRFQVILAALGVAALVASLWYPDGVLWWERLIGMAAGGGGFGLIYLAFLWIRKKEGMGIGDIKLVAAAGLLLGPWNLLIAVFAASLSASVILIIVQHRQGESQKEYPFAPFIAAGVIVALLFGQSIQSAYLGLFL